MGLARNFPRRSLQLAGRRQVHDRFLISGPLAIKNSGPGYILSLWAIPMRCVYLLAIAALNSWVGTLGAGVPSSIPSAYPARDGFKAVRWPSQAVFCGPNAMYMFLNAYDRPVSAKAFFREVDVGDRGMSLNDLRSASARYGLPAEVRRCTYEQLVSGCRLPLIALLHPGTNASDHNDGHYVLVVDADSAWVTVVDGTSGRQDQYPRDGFCRIWKGYVVVAAGKQPDWPMMAIGVTSLLLVAWLLVWLKHSGTDTIHSTALEIPTDASAT